MFDDLIPTIIQILIEEKKEMVVSEIAEESSFGEVEIQRGLNLLYDLGIVNRAELSKNNFKYFLVKELKGIHLAKAAQLGIDLNAFDKATSQLRKTRQISASKKRDRLPTNEELNLLTKYFFEKWSRATYSYPMHLIIWFAIYSCRREAEITRMELADYDQHNQLWKVRDLKNPTGSKGNNKEFHILPSCKQIVDLLMNPDIRNRMLKRGYSAEYLIPLSPKTIGGEFRKACKLLGIEDLKFHDLRHEGCTRLAEQGFTIPQIQQVSLHDSWGSLERYVSIKKRAKVIDYVDFNYAIKK